MRLFLRREYMYLPNCSAKSQPRLFPASALLLVKYACHVAPPVATLSCIDKYDTEFVPLASLMVACVPGVVPARYFMVVPLVTKLPTVLVVPALSFSVPLVRVRARVEPSVKASLQLHSPPIPLNTMGRSMVTPLVVIVFPVAVEKKLSKFVVAATVVVADRFKLP